MFFLRGGGVNVKCEWWKACRIGLIFETQNLVAPIDTVGPIDWYSENPNQGHSIFLYFIFISFLKGALPSMRSMEEQG